MPSLFRVLISYYCHVAWKGGLYLGTSIVNDFLILFLRLLLILFLV